MKTEELSTQFSTYSTKASDINRQISLSGLAIVWIFRETITDSEVSTSVTLILPTIFLLLSLAIDFLQYVYLTLFTGVLLEIKKRSNIHDGITFPWIYNRITWALFILKITTMIIAFIFLFKFLFILL